MKIKTDFVTNSSSVSFVGYGAYFYESELKDIFNDISLMLPGNKDNFDYRFHDQLDTLLEKHNLSSLI